MFKAYIINISHIQSFGNNIIELFPTVFYVDFVNGGGQITQSIKVSIRSDTSAEQIERAIINAVLNDAIIRNIIITHKDIVSFIIPSIG